MMDAIVSLAEAVALSGGDDGFSDMVNCEWA